MFYASCAIGAIAVIAISYINYKLNLTIYQTFSHMLCINLFIDNYLNLNRGKEYDSNFCTNLENELKSAYTLKNVSVEYVTKSEIVVTYTTQRDSIITRTVFLQY